MDKKNDQTSAAFAEAGSGKVEVGFFVPPAEDSSTIVLNRLAAQLANETSNIRMVIFKVDQPSDARIAESRRLEKKSYVHRKILEEEVFPFQRERGLAGNPEGILLCPELLAEKYPGRVRVERVLNPNDPAFVAQIAANDALKLAFSIRNLVIFKAPIIDTFQAKASNSLINLHPAKLPGPRGLEGPFWTRMKGETEYQTTMHVIDRGIDTGPILDYRSKSVNGDANRPVSIYTREAADDVASMIYHEIHLRVVRGSYRNPIANDSTQSTLHTLPTEEELDYAEMNGIRYTDGSEQISWILRNFSNPDADPEHNQELSQEVWGGYFDAGFGTRRKRKHYSDEIAVHGPVEAPAPVSNESHAPIPDYNPPVAGVR